MNKIQRIKEKRLTQKKRVLKGLIQKINLQIVLQKIKKDKFIHKKKY